MRFTDWCERLAAKREGAAWMARCPAHDDRNPSLALAKGDDGKTLLTCHAGCAVEAIVSALGLKVGDLFAENGKRNGREIVATYDYADADGTLLYQVVRYFPKTFKQRRPDGNGGWEWNLRGVDRVVYRLPDVLAAIQAGRRVFVCEGERDVEAVEAVGKVATCNPGGAGKWRTDYSESLRGANVVIVADRDEPGYDHARQVAAALDGIAAKVVIVEPATGKDVSEHLEAGRTLAELRPVKATDAKPKDAKAEGLALRHIRELLGEPDEAVEWLADGLLPAGGLSVLVGKPKAGKSTMARALAVAVARGEPWLGRVTSQGTVFYLALDRDPRRTLRQHFRELGATDDTPLYLFDGRVPADVLPQLEAAAREHKPALVVVDVLQRIVRAGDLNDYGAMTLLLEPLLNLARDVGAHVMLLHHSPKQEAAFAGDAPLGSTAIAGTVDTVLLVRRREDYRTLTTVQRCGDDLTESVVTLDGVHRPSLGGTRDEHETVQVGKAIVEFLEGQAEPVPERPDIREGVEGRTKLVAAALRQLVKDEKVTRSGGGKRGDPYRYAAPSDSGSLVPTPTREPENQKCPSGPNSNDDTTYSGSQKSAGAEPKPDAREPESGPPDPVLVRQAGELLAGRPDLSRDALLDALAPPDRRDEAVAALALAETEAA